MLLLPIGCDRAVIQRHAWISYGIIALNVIVFLTVCLGSDPAAESDLITKWQSTIAYMQDRAYLRAPATIVTLLPKKLADRPVDTRTGIPDWRIAAEQETLDSMAEEVRTLYDDAPRVRWSFIPALGSFSTLLTSIFVHAGLLHLLGNMFFFFATAPVVEDAFGRPLFVALYLIGGILATLSYAVRHADSVIPLMGASGAIAAVMGAFLVRFLMSRIELIWIPIIFLWRLHVRFFVPAFVILPLWLLLQFAAFPFEGESGGVAVTAHIAGFVFGVVFALVVRIARIEEKLEHPAVDKQTSSLGEPRLAAARAARADGDKAGARSAVSDLLRKQPANTEALRLAVDLAFEERDDRALDSLASRLLGRLIDEKQEEEAKNLIHDLAGVGSDRPLPLFLSRAAMHAEKWGDRRWAVTLYRRLVSVDANGPRAVSSLVKLGTLLRREGDLSGAREAFLRARSHQACTEEWITRINAGLRDLGEDSGGFAGETPWS
ncbi:MAG TPA: rhomboid family intramembrane serine protease [Thermoanaerobaculia bacterium]|nr:rhomboid family intramembrane serine protease [Thermoanaerobaculia bacterium]